MENPRRGMWLLVVSVPVAASTTSSVRTQDVDDGLADARETAKQLLNSPDAAHLSGAGHTLAQLVSGTAGLNSLVAPLARGNADVAVSFQSNRFQVMVNDPSQDAFELADLSTQSETSVAGYGSTVVVTFNDSGEFTQLPTFMGYSRSSDGDASFTDLSRA